MRWQCVSSASRAVYEASHCSHLYTVPQWSSWRSRSAALANTRVQHGPGAGGTGGVIGGSAAPALAGVEEHWSGELGSGGGGSCDGVEIEWTAGRGICARCAT